MISMMLNKEIDKAEEFLGANMDYLRHLQDQSLGAALKFFMFMPMAGHGKTADPNALAVARLVATKQEDCGPCVQATVNGALAAGADKAVVQAVLDADLETLSPTLRQVHDFAKSVARADPSATSQSEELSELLGAAAVMELSLAIASARVFPTLKRGMGFAQSCAMVKVEV